MILGGRSVVGELRVPGVGCLKTQYSRYEPVRAVWKVIRDKRSNERESGEITVVESFRGSQA